MKLEIDWREPPLSGEAQLQAVMKHHAGRWARVKKDMASTTASSAWRKAGFQTEVHQAEGNPKKYDIYARWPAEPVDLKTQLTATIEPTTASKAKPVTTKGGVPVKAAQPKPPADVDDLGIPTSGDVTGGYMAQRAARGVAADGAKEIRLAGHNPSVVRP